MVAINPATTGGGRRQPQSTIGRIFLRFLLLSLCIAIYTGTLKRQRNQVILAHNNTNDEGQPIKSASTAAATSQQKDWSHCLESQPNLKSTAQAPHDKVKNPLWLPAYPTSLPEGYANFLAELTGITSASKSYYRSSKTLKRCHNLNLKSGFDGVTCEIVHPIVPCNRPSPGAQAANFGSVVFVALRNPLTAFPSYHQEKAEKYHNAKGQVPKEEWISFRDLYVGNATHNPLFQEWKEFVLEWRNMEPYHVAMYLSHEEWVDEERGVEMVTKFAHVLNDEGFPIRYDDKDLACLWYNNVMQPELQKKKKHADEGRYVSEYTTEQRMFLAAELRKFVDEIDNTRPGDEQLKSILTSYIESFV